MKISSLVKSALPAAILGVVALSFAPAPAFATTNVPTTFSVTATVQATCIISAGSLGFGTYTGVVAHSTSTISVTCTNTTPYNVALNPGATSGATVTTRQMLNGAAALNYGLYKDATWTTNWGQTTGTDTSAGTGNGSAQTLTVYGQVSAGQYVTPGSYSDTITATVIY
jgi:spore coat protein U-like protein